MSASKDDTSRTNPWDAQKLDVTGSWSASKSPAPRKRTAEIPETLVAPDIDPLPQTPSTGDLLAGRFASDESSPSLDWDPDGDTDAVPPAEEPDAARQAEANAHADALEVELLAAADPSTDAPTGEMTIPSFLGPEDTLESVAPPRVVQGRVPNGFVTDGSASSVWANTPIRAKAIKDAPRIELRRRRRPLVKIDDASAAETTEWMAQGVGATTDAEGLPFGPRVVDQTDGGIDVEALSDDAISQIDPEPVKPLRTNASDVIYVRRSSSGSAEPDPFRAFVLNRRGPEDDVEPPPAWAGMIGQTAKWILVVAGGIGLACIGMMALTGRLPF